MDQKATRTTFPLRLERDISLPSRVGRVKSGAGALISTGPAAWVEKAAKTKQSEQTTAKSKEMRDDRFFALPRSGRQFQRLIPFTILLLSPKKGPSPLN